MGVATARAQAGAHADFDALTAPVTRDQVRALRAALRGTPFGRVPVGRTLSSIATIIFVPLLAIIIVGLIGMIFSFGSARMSTDVITVGASKQLDFGNYRSTMAVPFRGAKHFAWGYVRYQLPRRLPHMVLEARANRRFGQSTMPSAFNRGQMFFYSRAPFNMLRPETYELVEQLVSTIGAKTWHQTERYADDRAGIHAGRFVAPRGRRLARVVPIGTAVTFVVWIVLHLAGPIVSAVTQH
jgi:hypothetical protein